MIIRVCISKYLNILFQGIEAAEQYKRVMRYLRKAYIHAWHRDCQKKRKEKGVTKLHKYKHTMIQARIIN